MLLSSIKLSSALVYQYCSFNKYTSALKDCQHIYDTYKIKLIGQQQSWLRKEQLNQLAQRQKQKQQKQTQQRQKNQNEQGAKVQVEPANDSDAKKIQASSVREMIDQHREFNHEQQKKQESIHGSQDNKSTEKQIPEMQLIEQRRKSSGEFPKLEYSQDPHMHQNEQKKLENSAKTQRQLRYVSRIDDIFNEYVPIIFSVLVLGILMHSTYIFSMCCFFAYAFCSLLFNYIGLLSKLKNGPDQNSFIAKINNIISPLCILALFISYWIIIQF